MMTHMRVITVIAVVLLFGAMNISAQCSTDSVCVPQATIDRAARAADELAAARIAITKLEAERDVSTVAIRSAQTAIDSLQRAVQVGKDIQTIQEQVIETLKGIIKLQSEIIERYEKQLSRGKSGWQKFVNVLKTIATIAFGIGIGRGL